MNLNQKVSRKFYNKRDYFIDWDKKVIVLSDVLFEQLKNGGKFSKYKKIGGSSVGDILIKNNIFKSEFKAFLHITRLKMPVLSKKYINAGVILEPKIFDVLKKAQPSWQIEHIEAEKVNYDYFYDIDEVIGGVPDGFSKPLKMVFEIKTAGEKKYEDWTKNNNIDPSYLKQSQLYCYLMSKKLNEKIDKFSIVALFLKDDKENNINDYEKPEFVNLYERKLQTFSYKVNENQAKEDIQIIKEWYFKYTNQKESPNFDEVSNYDDLEYLKCETEQEWINLLNKWKNEGKADKDCQP
ncbi:MAGa7180 family putative nuclease [Mycoplasma leonicaptivi]|uniref:MAGa7180 family putative nuclease n=1 Tax=Mycoplasma leonicaptivi TaxID=36742 RepID=UPI0004894823|nr:hypothetical protein [Mycoplasma leonicaptivi]